MHLNLTILDKELYKFISKQITENITFEVRLPGKPDWCHDFPIPTLPRPHLHHPNSNLARNQIFLHVSHA